MKFLAKPTKHAEIAIHLFIWLFLFCVPYLLSSGKFESIERLAEMTWIPLAFYAISFYTNYLWLTKKLFLENKPVQFALLNMGLILLFLLVHFVIRISGLLPLPEMHGPMPPMMGHRMHDKPPVSLFMYKDIISYLIPIIFAIGVRAFQQWSKAEAVQKEAEKERLSSELQHLKYQLQPHFFFNSLNNIYSLVDIDAERAKESIHTLGKLMRYMLYESDTESISLSKEIDLISRYIELMKMRCSDKTHIEYEFPKQNTEQIQIPPLLFISLIENAFKHGVSATEQTHIEFKIEIKNERLYFESKNDNLPKLSTDKSGSGIGVENLRKRLNLLSEGEYKLEKEVTDKEFIIRLNFKLTDTQTKHLSV